MAPKRPIGFRPPPPPGSANANANAPNPNPNPDPNTNTNTSANALPPYATPKLHSPFPQRRGPPGVRMGPVRRQAPTSNNAYGGNFNRGIIINNNINSNNQMPQQQQQQQQQPFGLRPGFQGRRMPLPVRRIMPPRGGVGLPGTGLGVPTRAGPNMLPRSVVPPASRVPPAVPPKELKEAQYTQGNDNQVMPMSVRSPPPVPARLVGRSPLNVVRAKVPLEPVVGAGSAANRRGAIGVSSGVGNGSGSGSGSGVSPLPQRAWISPSSSFGSLPTAASPAPALALPPRVLENLSSAEQRELLDQTRDARTVSAATGSSSQPALSQSGGSTRAVKTRQTSPALDVVNRRAVVPRSCDTVQYVFRICAPPKNRIVRSVQASFPSMSDITLPEVRRQLGITDSKLRLECWVEGLKRWHHMHTGVDVMYIVDNACFRMLSVAEHKKKMRAEARRKKDLAKQKQKAMKGKKSKDSAGPQGKSIDREVKVATIRSGKVNPNDAYFDRTDSLLPALVTEAIAYLHEHIDLEGVFRISGALTETKEIRHAFVVDRRENVDLGRYDPHSVAGALKLWLRELDNPLMTYECYNLWLVALDEPENLRIRAVRAVLEGLPPGNAVTIQAIVQFLKTVAERADVNYMTSENLAVVFAPTLLRSPSEEENATQMMAKSAGPTVALVKLLIDEFDAIWMNDDDDEYTTSTSVDNALDVFGLGEIEEDEEKSLFSPGFRKSMAVASMQVFRAVGRELAGEERLSRSDIARGLQEEDPNHMSLLLEQLFDEGRHRSINRSVDPSADDVDGFYSPSTTEERAGGVNDATLAASFSATAREWENIGESDDPQSTAKRENMEAEAHDEEDKTTETKLDALVEAEAEANSEAEGRAIAIGIARVGAVPQFQPEARSKAEARTEVDILADALADPDADVHAHVDSDDAVEAVAGMKDAHGKSERDEASLSNESDDIDIWGDTEDIDAQGHSEAQTMAERKIELGDFSVASSLDEELMITIKLDDEIGFHMWSSAKSEVCLDLIKKEFELNFEVMWSYNIYVEAPDGTRRKVDTDLQLSDAVDIACELSTNLVFVVVKA